MASSSDKKTNTKQLKVDDEIRPTIEAVGDATDRLLDIARRVYVPSNVADTVIGEVLPVPQQLQLYVASAYVVLVSMYCQKKLANEPIPEKLKEQIRRVQAYLKKLKDHGIDDISGGGGSDESTTVSAAGSRRQRDGDMLVAAQQGSQPPKNDAAAAATTTKQQQQRKQVDPVAVKNVGKMLENKHKRDMGK